MESDNLLTRESGEWVKKKHHFLRRYCDMFTVSMRRKWSLSYFDMLAGPGRCMIRETGELVPGSPFVALDYDFDKYYSYESDQICVEALRKRIAIHTKADRCEIIQNDWAASVLSPTFRLPSGLILAFIDPTGISQIPWNAMQKLATSSNRIDILITIQHGMGIRLNQRQYLTAKKDQTAVDAFLGNHEWRSKFQGSQNFCEAILSQFTQNMAGLGFQTRKWIPVKIDAGTVLYYLCLFSRHNLALKFWDQVVLKDETGQRAMDI